MCFFYIVSWQIYMVKVQRNHILILVVSVPSLLLPAHATFLFSPSSCWLLLAWPEMLSGGCFWQLWRRSAASATISCLSFLLHFLCLFLSFVPPSLPLPSLLLLPLFLPFLSPSPPSFPLSPSFPPPASPPSFPPPLYSSYSSSSSSSSTNRGLIAGMRVLNRRVGAGFWGCTKMLIVHLANRHGLTLVPRCPIAVKTHWPLLQQTHKDCKNVTRFIFPRVRFKRALWRHKALSVYELS